MSQRKEALPDVVPHADRTDRRGAVPPQRRSDRHEDRQRRRLPRCRRPRPRCTSRSRGSTPWPTRSGTSAISINFSWLLITGFLVLFMQVGFAFLVTGLTRAKNAGHMMMMNLSSFVIALLAYYTIGFAFQFGGINLVAGTGNIGGTSPLNSLFGHGSAGVIGLHGFFLQSGNTLRRRGARVLPVPGRLHGDRGLHHHRRDRGAHLVRRVHLRRDRHGRPHLPDLRELGVGRRLAVAARHVDGARARRGRLRRIRGGARDGRLGGARARDAARATHREVPRATARSARSPVTTSATW